MNLWQDSFSNYTSFLARNRSDMMIFSYLYTCMDIKKTILLILFLTVTVTLIAKSLSNVEPMNWLGDSSFTYSYEELFDQHYQEAKALLSSDLDEALKAAHQAKDIAFQLKSTEHIGKAHWMLGYIYHIRKDFKPAIEYYFSAFRAYRKLGNDKNSAFMLQNIGALCLDNEAYEEAIEFYQQRLEYAKKLDEESHVKALYDLSLSYKFSDQLDRAVSSIVEAKQLLNQDYQLADTIMMADLYVELGIIYEKMAILDENKTFLDSARIQYIKAGKINRSSLFKAKLQNNTGNTYLTEEKPDQALIEFNEGLQLRDRLTASSLEMTMLMNKGIAYYQKGSHDMAFTYLKESMDIQLKKARGLNDFDLKNNIQTNTIPYFNIAYEYLDKLAAIDPLEYNYPSKEIIRRFAEIAKDSTLIESATTLIIIRTANQVLKKEKDRQHLWTIGIVSILVLIISILLINTFIAETVYRAIKKSFKELQGSTKH